jgi:hypothetical protein
MFQSNDPAFRKALAPYVRVVCGSFRIVESQEHSGKTNKIGDLGSILYTEKKKAAYYASPFLKLARLQARNIRLLRNMVNLLYIWHNRLPWPDSVHSVKQCVACTLWSPSITMCKRKAGG